MFFSFLPCNYRIIPFFPTGYRNTRSTVVFSLSSILSTFNVQIYMNRCYQRTQTVKLKIKLVPENIPLVSSFEIIHTILKVFYSKNFKILFKKYLHTVSVLVAYTASMEFLSISTRLCKFWGVP